MELSKKQNAFAFLTTLVVSSLVSPTSHGGAITSANAPPPPPPTVVPGVIRLTCTLSVGNSHELLNVKDYDRRNFAEAFLDFEKADGADYFKCTEGCDPIIWSRNRTEHPSGDVKPVSKVTLTGQIGLPSLRIKLIDSKPFLETRVESAHRSWTGAVITNKNDSLVPFVGREFYAEARTDERVEFEKIEDLKKLANETKRLVASSSRGSTELRCTVIKPGQVSKAQTAKIYAAAPRQGTISSKDYESATSIHHITQPYSTILDLARKLDPDHRKAMIADMTVLRGSLDFMKPIVEKVRDAVATHPKMTGENAWGYIASLLGIHPMSPSGIVLPTIVPLLIAEEDAAKTEMTK